MTVLYDAPVPYFDMETWRLGTKETYNIFHYKFDNFQKLLKHVFPKMSWVRRVLTRGFTDGIYIYVLNPKHWYGSIKYQTMVWHEIGHIKGEGHTWKPTLMNPSWLFRWF